MKRTTILLSIAALLCAMPNPKHTTANALSQYKKTSYRDGGVVLRMNADKGSILNPGQDVSFTYQTADDAYVILFNIDTEGYVNLIAPVDGRVERARARETYRVPNNGEHLVVSGETGMEFVFALSVADPSAIDSEELAYLSNLDMVSRADRYRIDGDPFIAANIVAGELVRGITHRQGVFLDYVYFYVNQRVDHPCYLCGDCDGAEASADCADYDFVAHFDRSMPLTYPLERAYDMVDRGGANTDGVQAVYDDDTRGADDVNVNFYPYSVETRYVTRPVVYAYDPWYWDDPFWNDPWYRGWVYYPTWHYPYYRNYWGWSFAWGSWGGYYCSGWYSPRYHHWHDYYHDNYYAYRTVNYKSAYKSRSQTLYKSSTSPLVTTRSQAVKRNDRLRIASTDLRRTSTKTRSVDRNRTTTRSTTTRDTWRAESKPTRVYTPRTGRTMTAYRGDESGRSTRGYTGTDSRTRSSRPGSSSYHPVFRSKRSTSSVDRSRSTGRSKSSETYRKGSSGSSRSGSSRAPAVKRSSSSSKSSARSSSRSSGSSSSKGSSRSSSKAKRK